MKRPSLLLISILFITAACTSQPAGTGGLAIPSQWTLVSFGPSGAETPVVSGSTITLDFAADGQAGGSGGCNSYGGRFELQGSTITFSDIASTLVACAEEPVMQQEGQFFQALQTADRIEISGDSLTIFYDNGQGRLNFVKQ